METENKAVQRPHQGKNISRIRRAQGMKQEALALKMNTSQQVISLLEQKKEIDNEMLQEVAKALNVTPEIIRELEDDPASLVVENNSFESGSIGNISPYSENNNSQSDFNNTHNPIEEVVKLSNERAALYERMLEIEKKNSSLLEQMLKEKKE